MTTKSVASSPLNGVMTLARRIWATLRLLWVSVALVRPAATRSATCAAVSPVAGVAKGARTGAGAGPPLMPVLVEVLIEPSA
jgi:hypothetical protein